MQHLLLLRHGQTDANAANIVQGHMPTELNELGHRQSRLLAARLAKFEPRIELLLCSPLRRAVQTAEPVAAALGLPLEIAPFWVERYFGSGQGKPADLARIISHGTLSHVDPPDAEPKDAFDARVREAIESVPPLGITAVVTHGGVIGSVYRQLIDGRIACLNPPRTRPSVLNCSLQHLVRPSPGDPWSVVCLSDASHLQGAESAADAG